jgi:hypothetical protein
MPGLSYGHRELVECCADPVAGGDVGGEFVVATAEVLDEGMPGGQGPRGQVAFQAAHRPEPVRFQNSAIGPDLGFYAARSYSLMRPPSTGRRWIHFRERSATG